MGQGKKIHKAFKLLMEDEVAFQTFIKEEFENHNIIFNDSDFFTSNNWYCWLTQSYEYK